MSLELVGRRRHSPGIFVPVNFTVFTQHNTRSRSQRGGTGGSDMPRSAWKGPYVAVALLEDVIAFARR